MADVDPEADVQEGSQEQPEAPAPEAADPVESEVAASVPEDPNPPGPGPHEGIPADEAEEIAEPAPETEPAPEPEPPSFADVLTDAVGAGPANALMADGYMSVESLSAASNDALLDIKGVGPSTLEKIRVLAPLYPSEPAPENVAGDTPPAPEFLDDDAEEPQKSARVRRIHDASN